MGVQLGLVHLSGQFGDIQLTIDRNKGRAKLSRPITKERIDTAPEFRNTRRVNKEFEAAAMAVDILQDCLCGNHLTFGDRFFRARLQSILIEAVRRGPGHFGERALEVVPNLTKLDDFPMDEEDRFKSWFNIPYNLLVNPARDTVTLSIPAFDIFGGKCRVPQAANDFRIFQCVGLLSDLQFSSTDARYEPVNPELSGLSVENSTAWMPVAGTNPGINLVTQVPGLPLIPATAGLVVSIGIQYCRTVNGYHYPLAAGNAMDIIDVF
jgi:hypothetical protein